MQLQWIFRERVSVSLALIEFRGWPRIEQMYQMSCFSNLPEYAPINAVPVGYKKARVVVFNQDGKLMTWVIGRLIDWCIHGLMALRFKPKQQGPQKYMM